MALSERIEAIRKRIRKSQSEFAAQFGISLSAFKRYEKGQIEPAPSALVAICEEYGISANWLMLDKGRQTTEGERERVKQAFLITETIAPDYNIEDKIQLFMLIYDFSEKNDIDNVELVGNIFKLGMKDR